MSHQSLPSSSINTCRNDTRILDDKINSTPKKHEEYDKGNYNKSPIES